MKNCSKFQCFSRAEATACTRCGSAIRRLEQQLKYHLRWFLSSEYKNVPVFNGCQQRRSRQRMAVGSCGQLNNNTAIRRVRPRGKHKAKVTFLV